MDDAKVVIGPGLQVQREISSHGNLQSASGALFLDWFRARARVFRSPPSTTGRLGLGVLYSHWTWTSWVLSIPDVKKQKQKPHTEGLKRWLSISEQLLLMLKKSRFWFSEPMWSPTTSCYSSWESRHYKHMMCIHTSRQTLIHTK